MSRKFVTFFVGKRSRLRRNQPLSSHRVFVGAGSNVGNRRRNLESALRFLAAVPGLILEASSSLYETEPVGGPLQRNHLNGVFQIQSSLSLTKLGVALKRIEKKMGRQRGIHWGPRVLDLDILLFGSLCRRSGGFVVPHPRYHERRFVLVPLCELAPALRHPKLKLTHQQLLSGLTVKGQRVTMAARWKNGRFYPFKRRKNPNSR